MTVVSWFIGLPVAVIVIVFAVVNRLSVPVDLWPLPWEVGLPVYLLVLGPFAVGIMGGGVLGWMSARRARGQARAQDRRANALANEVEQLRAENKTLSQTQSPEAPSPKALPGRSQR